jgi:hypothetical protein
MTIEISITLKVNSYCSKNYNRTVVLYDIKQYFEQVLKTSPKNLFLKFYNAIEYLEKNLFLS